MKLRILFIASLWFLVVAPAADAGCVGCTGQGDVGIKKSATDVWGTPSTPDDSTHNHDFGALCDAANLASYTGEVHIKIAVTADLEGSIKYVTATSSAAPRRRRSSSGTALSMPPATASSSRMTASPDVAER